jgi:indolepyruvate ferredoxin oxidoreductase alpha subunit
LVDFLRSVDTVLVVEELTPFVEEWVCVTAFRAGRTIPVFGKHTGHLPVEFEYCPDLVEDAVRRYLELGERVRTSVVVPELPPRPPVLCPGCPHRTSFYLVNKVFGKRTVYCNDIGCYTLGYGEPLHACDVLLCMGASISLASGIARTTGQRTVAYIGDSTFFHSGLPALVNAVQADDNITVVILDNYITAMTGFQPSPTTDTKRSEPAQTGSPTVGDATADLHRGRRAGLGSARYIPLIHSTKRRRWLAKQAKRGKGVNVVICHSPCGPDVVSRGASSSEISQEQCNACSLCVRVLGRPRF